METEKSTEQIVFKLFLDAVMRRDKKQFAYYDLYSNIVHADDVMQKAKTDDEMEQMQ